MAQKSQMLLRKTLQNTKTFFHKTLQNFKSYLLGDYPKLPQDKKQIFGRCIGNQKNPEPDNIWRNTLDEVMDKAILLQKMQKREREQEECSESIISMSISDKSMLKERGQVERKIENRQEVKKRELSSPSLARRLKKLEMMEPSNVEHVLDVEEVLHYYSRLTSPVYVDIVDEFCTDMCKEYSLQQASVNIIANNSMRRNGSLRSLGPITLETANRS